MNTARTAVSTRRGATCNTARVQCVPPRSATRRYGGRLTARPPLRRDVGPPGDPGAQAPAQEQPRERAQAGARPRAAPDAGHPHPGGALRAQQPAGVGPQGRVGPQEGRGGAALRGAVRRHHVLPHAGRCDDATRAGRPRGARGRLARSPRAAACRAGLISDQFTWEARGKQSESTFRPNPRNIAPRPKEWKPVAPLSY